MRLFHALILDECLAGSGGLAYSSNAWACLLARAESLKFFCIADRVSGTPTIRIDLLGKVASDTSYETSKKLFDATIQSGANPMLTYGPGDASYPPLRYLQLWARTTAGSGTAHLRIWVCGRGPQLLEPIPPAASSFAAQYAAAKMLDQESVPRLKQESPRSGASYFYPPEIFEPSLEWER